MNAVRLRPRARVDRQEAVRYYREAAGVSCATRLVASIRRDLETLNSHPGIGSPAFGDRLGLPGLRAWRVTDFPMLIFYIEREDHLDVVRILGERQDIGTIMNSEP